MITIHRHFLITYCSILNNSVQQSVAKFNHPGDRKMPSVYLDAALNQYLSCSSISHDSSTNSWRHLHSMRVTLTRIVLARPRIYTTPICCWTSNTSMLLNINVGSSFYLNCFPALRLHVGSEKWIMWNGTWSWSRGPNVRVLSYFFECLLLQCCGAKQSGPSGSLR